MIDAIGTTSNLVEVELLAAVSDVLVHIEPAKKTRLEKDQ